MHVCVDNKVIRGIRMHDGSHVLYIKVTAITDENNESGHHL
jgi:hypothetical protein